MIRGAYIAGISFFFNQSYKQPPFEDISEGEFNDMVKHLHSIDLSKVIEEEDNTAARDEIACAGGACEVGQ